MRKLFDANLYRFEKPQPSYWEATASAPAAPGTRLENDVQCDVAVIGGGYTGLSTALHLARDFGVDVRVLEAGHIGWGASGRNGGFCTIGGTGFSRAALIRRHGLDNARAYYRAQVEAVELVRQVIEDEAIDAESIGAGEIEVAHSAYAFRSLEKDVALLSNSLGLDAELWSARECRDRVYSSTEAHGALVLRPAFGLHPLRYCQGLANAAQRHGVKLHPRSEVVRWASDGGGRQRLMTRTGSVFAKTVVFATNGFMPDDLHDAFRARTLPMISAIVVTRPLSESELSAHRWTSRDVIINSRRIFNYYRLLPDGRLLFGGRGHTRGTPQGERRTYRLLENVIGEIWPEWRDVDIDYRWHGLICATGSLTPAIGTLPDDANVFFAYGYHGTGVNTATWAGRQLAEWIGTGVVPAGLPEIMRGIGPRIALLRFQRQVLRAAIVGARMLDAVF